VIGLAAATSQTPYGGAPAPTRGSAGGSAWTAPGLVTPLVVALVARRFGLGGGIALAAGFALAAAGWVWLLPETRGRRIG